MVPTSAVGGGTMRGLRISVGDAMFWVGLVAVDCGLIRPLFGYEYLDALRALSLLPMANALPILARRLVRRPASRRPFAVGFLGGGAAAVVGLLALGWARGEAVDPVTMTIADALSFPLGQLGLGLQDVARSLAGGWVLAWPLQGCGRGGRLQPGVGRLDVPAVGRGAARRDAGVGLGAGPASARRPRCRVEVRA